MINFFFNKNKRFIIFILSFCFLSLSASQNCLARILDKRGKVLKEVVEIFRQYQPLIDQYREDIEKRGLPCEKIESILNPKTPSTMVALKDLNDIAQVVFLRPANKERKDIKDYNENFLPYTSGKVLNLFHFIGDLKSIYPRRNHYRYIFINGSTVKNMRQRLKTLVDLIKMGKLVLRPETEIIFLTGERDLFPEEDETQLMEVAPLKLNPAWQRPSVLPVTEDQAAEWIWNQSKLPAPLRRVKITFVRAKKKLEKDLVTGEMILKRPTTLDTINTLIVKEEIQPGACLSVSIPPFIYYQEAIIAGAFKRAGLMKKGFKVEGVGLCNKKWNLKELQKEIAVILDNFARTIYTEVQNENLGSF